MKNWASALLGVFVFFGSATANAEGIKLSEWVKDFRSTLSSRAFTVDQCVATLKAQYIHMFDLDYLKIDQMDLKTNGKNIARQAFLARLDMRKKIRNWEQVQNPIANDCIRSVRDSMRVLRYLEETAGVTVVHPKSYDENNVAPYLAGEAPYLQKNPKYKALSFPADLKSGDLLVSRGNAPTSALIARLGDVDGQFSHLAMVYVDSRHRVFVMEAHIEVGSTVRPYAEYANDHNFRVVVYRYKDSKIAAAAAGKMFERLSDQKDPQYPHVAPYDFNMIMDDDRELFCSEVGYQAFKMGSNGSVHLGKYRTEFNPKNRYLLDQLDVKVKSMFAPSDMEVEPDFEVLAEWRDLSRVLENQRMDAILTKFLAWADEDQYHLDPTFVMDLKTELAFTLRRDRLLHSLVDKKVPLNMTKNAIKVVMALDAVVGTLSEFLATKNTEKLRSTHFPLTFREMYQWLEDYRAGLVAGEDTSQFNKLYHP